MNKINKIEICSLSYFIIRAFFISITFTNLTTLSKQDSYMSMIVGIILGFIPLILFYIIYNYKPKLPLSIKNIKLFGHILGTIINIILIWFTCFLVLILFHNLVTFIHIQYLNKTPIIIISVILISTIIYSLLHGLKTICRTATILLFFSIIFFILSLFGIGTQININNFKPLLESNINSIFKGSFIYILYNVLPLYLLLIIPKNDIKNKNFVRYITIFYIIASISLFLVLTATIGTLGIQLCNIYKYPTFEVLKNVSLIGTNSRIDGILIIQWIFDLLISITFGLYFILESTKSLFKVNKYIYSIVLSIILILLNIIIL